MQVTNDRRRLLRATTAIALISAVLAISLVWIASSQMLYPFWYEPGLKPVDADDFAYQTWEGIQHPNDLEVSYQDVSFPAVDGDSLRGWWIPLEDARGAVVTAHGGGSDRRDFLRHVPLLRRAGFGVLLFDCREHGASDIQGRGISGGFRESEDVSAAVDYLYEKGVENIVVLGTSQGASSALIAASRNRKIRAVIAENPVANLDTLIRESLLIEKLPIPDFMLSAMSRLAFWRMGTRGDWEALDVVSKVAPTPILFIHGLDDVVVPPHHSELLFAAAGEPRDVWWVSGATHMRLINRDPREYERRVIKFLADEL